VCLGDIGSETPQWSSKERGDRQRSEDRQLLLDNWIWNRVEASDDMSELIEFIESALLVDVLLSAGSRVAYARAAACRLQGEETWKACSVKVKR
jgi:hypothetical protein